MRPAISWHRGGKEFQQSDTEASFADAARRGAEWIEVDVRRSADGVLLCAHDDDVEGIGRLSLVRVVDLTNDLASRLLSFEQFLDLLDREDPERTTGIHLDLKGTGFEVAVVDAVRHRNRPLFVTTPDDSSLIRLADERPEVTALMTIGTSRTGLSWWRVFLLRVGETFPMRRIARTRARGVAIHYRLLRWPLRRWCTRRGLMIVVWTVNRSTDLAHWVTQEIDVVTTDRPARAIEMRAG